MYHHRLLNGGTVTTIYHIQILRFKCEKVINENEYGGVGGISTYYATGSVTQDSYKQIEDL